MKIGTSGPIAPTAALPYPLRVPSALQCAFLIFGIKASLTMAGFGRTVCWLHRRVARIPFIAEPHAELVKRTAYSVALAAALYPGRALCLEQSLTLFYCLRRRGVHADLRLGVQPHPFEAHAWVEYRGVPINEFPERVKHFTPLPAFHE